MKAKEYYILLKKEIDDGKELTIKFYVSLLTQLSYFSIHIKNDALSYRFDVIGMSIIKEMNDKWNAIVRLLEREYGQSSIIRDGYKRVWIAQIPELKEHV